MLSVCQPLDAALPCLTASFYNIQRNHRAQPHEDRAAVLGHLHLNRLPAAVPYPAASRTSANAWLMNVWRPWWIVRSARRSPPRQRQAVRKRLRSMCRPRPSLLLPSQTTLGSGSVAASVTSLALL
jgi:hypothetical protein